MSTSRRIDNAAPFAIFSEVNPRNRDQRDEGVASPIFPIFGHALGAFSCPLACPDFDPILPVSLHVSFIIPLHNGIDHTRSLYADLRETLPPSLDHEIIFVDNASVDGTRSWLLSLADPCVKIFENPENAGYARANNQAAAIARGEFLCLLNNDLRLLPGWFEPLLRLARSESRTLVGNVQLSVRTRQIDHAGIFFDPARSPYHFRPPLRFLFPPRSIAAPALTGACLMVARSDYRELGGFDEQFVNSYEDIDFCLRAGQRGFTCRVALESVVLHYIGSTAGRQDAESANAARFHARWDPLLPAPAFPPPAVPSTPEAGNRLRQQLAQLATLQVYHPDPTGLSEIRSTQVVYRTESWNDVGFSLPRGLQAGATRLRIDPCDFPGEIYLRAFRLVDPELRVCFEVNTKGDLGQLFRPGGTSTECRDANTFGLRSTGQDPQLMLEPSAIPPELVSRHDLRAELSLQVRPLNVSRTEPENPADPATSASRAELPIRVAVDLTQFENGGLNGGVKPLAFGLLKAVGQQHPDRFSFTYFFRPGLAAEVEALIRPGDTGVQLDPNAGTASSRVQSVRVLPPDWQRIWPADLLYSPLGSSDLAGSGLPWVSLLIDTLHRDLPEMLPPAEVVYREHWFREVLDQANAVHCISEFVCSQLQHHFGAPADRMFVAPNGVHEDLVELARTSTAPPPTANPYFFYPANDWPHKNHERLLLAYRDYRLAAGNSAWDLVLAGHFAQPEQMRRRIEELGLKRSCHILGFADRATFAGIFRQAGALIFPSLYEGFGIPVIEAMALGVPVACSRAASLPEVAGEAARYFNPTDTRSLVDAMVELSTNATLRESFVTSGRARALQFTLSDAVDQLADQFLQVVGQPTEG